MTTRYLILAAGLGYRWHDHLGVPKHLITLDGETILGRTVRQLVERGCETWIVGPDDPRYAFKCHTVPGAKLWTPWQKYPTGTQVDKFLSSEPIWNTEGRTVWLWGDVWWSDGAMTTLTSWSGDDPWHVWLRPGASHLNGCGNGEMFAHAFDVDQHDAERAACARVAQLAAEDKIPWLNTGGWSHYRAMLGLDDDLVHGWVDAYTAGRNATTIDDWTNDFDAPGDYVAWYGRRAQGKYPITVKFDGTSPEVRDGWPSSSTQRPAAVVSVRGDLRISDQQLWCGVAHAVEHQVPVVPYSHASGTLRSCGEPMWTADDTDRRIVISPAKRIGTSSWRADDVAPVRLYGYCQDLGMVTG